MNRTPVKRKFPLQFDDGRATLVLGSILILVFSLTEASLEEYGYRALWTMRLLLDIVRDLGIAFIVGGIVSLGIERISRSRFLAEIEAEIHRVQKNVINAAYLKSYPDDYTDGIIRMLDTTRYYKIALNIVIDISETGNEDDLISSDGVIIHDQTSSYLAKNVTRDVQSLQPRQFLDAGWDRKTPVLLEWRVGDIVKTQKELAALHGAQTDDGFAWYTFPEAVTVGPGEEIFVSTTVRTFKRRRDTTTWCGIQPADSLNFTVNHPHSFEAYAQAKTASRNSEAPISSNGTRVKVSIFKPLMPYMVVEYGWRPGKGATATGTDLSGGISPPN